MSISKPRVLRSGDRVAAVCDSWGGAAACPHRFQTGVNQIADEFGLQVLATAHALRDADWLRNHPEARASDLMEAFADPEIKGIFSVIGGEESIRLLPHLDIEVMRANPKVFVGFSDTTVTHFALLKAGIVTFYGPSVLAGFAENCGMHSYMVDSIRRTLISTDPIGAIEPNDDGWTVERLEWIDPANQSIRRKLAPAMPWQWIQGSGVVRGKLMGGCLEVIDWLRGTDVWPSRDEWRGSLLAIETSEERPGPLAITRMLRACAAAGMFTEPAGLLVGRPCTDDEAEMEAHDQAILNFVRDELGLTNLPIVTRMDFGHTSPVFTLPLGIEATLDCDAQCFTIPDSVTT